jgi:hypothetical protein
VRYCCNVRRNCKEAKHLPRANNHVR